MKSMLKFIAVAVIGAATLSACGGHYKPPEAVVVVQPEYKQTDTLVGTGTAASTGVIKTYTDPTNANIKIPYPSGSQLVTINFTGYLYDSSKPDGKGAVVETSAPGESRSPVQPFTVGVGKPIAGTTVLIGFDQALLGEKVGTNPQVPMNVGGKRTVVLPANLAYGANSLPAQTVNGKSFAAVPANSPMVYDIELVSITVLPDIVPTLPTVVTDLLTPVAGTGAVAAVGKTAVVRYTLYAFDGTVADRRGKVIETNVVATGTTGNPPAAFEFLVVADGTTPSVVVGFNQAIRGMLVGGRRTVLIPAALGYGATGNSTIAPNTPLVFDLFLENVK